MLILKNSIVKKLVIFFVSFVLLFCLLPFYIMIISSTLSTQEIKTTMTLMPGVDFANNYARLMGYFNIWKGLLNSFIISFIYTILSIYLSSLCGFAFSKVNFRHKELLFVVLLVMLFIPNNIAIIGFYKLFLSLNMIDSFIPLILPGIIEASTLILSRRYCDIAIKNSIVDAGQIDGASSFIIFNMVILPNIRSMIICMGVLSFIQKWNEFIIPSIIINSQDKRTLPMLIASTKMFFGIDYGAKYVAIFISTMPILFLFLFFSNKIISITNDDPEM